MYYVEVVKYGTDEVVKRIPCGASERSADRVDRGVNINLDSENYYTRVVYKPAPAGGEARP